MTVPLTGTSTVSKDAYKQLLLSRNPQAPLEVLDHYYEQESIWQLRADALIPQMLLETDYLRSWWSQAPRRNMAGIGVTGASQKNNPNSAAYAFKSDDSNWYAGYSFDSWESAVEAHFAHMSAYVWPDERNSASQKDPRYAAARQAFAQNHWSYCQVLTDLNGRWAVPGTTYGQSIETILNAAASLGTTSGQVAQAGVTQIMATPNIIDLTAKTPSSVYTASRSPYKVILLVLHDTVGGDSAPDSNSLGLGTAGYQQREDGTIQWFQGGGGLSIHYLVGPEATGAKIYKLCGEEHVAYHAGGTTNFPSSWTAPDGTHYASRFNGVSVINYISIGIERWGSDKEAAGPLQKQAMIALALDIARRYNLSPAQIVAHKELEGDRQDGGVLRDTIRQALSQPQATTPAPVVSTPAQPATPAPTNTQPQIVETVTVIPATNTSTPAPEPAQPAQTVPASDATTSPWAQGVSGVVNYLGSGTPQNDGVIVRNKPSLGAQQLRTLQSNTPLRFIGYTNSGDDAGVGPRWYLIDSADGGGWVYSGSVKI